MGLFSKKKEVTPEELAALEENKKILDEFNVTKSWGIKKYETATQFIYDEDMKAFVVVEGPDATFKERNPWVIKFDQVEDVWLEVDEWWSEDNSPYNKFHDYHILKMGDYSKVFWHYDLYLNFRTSHPYCKEIRYKMNYKTNILRIPGFHLFAIRGLELTGKYHGKEIKEQTVRLDELCEKIKGNVKATKTFDLLTGQRPETIGGLLAKDLTDEWYITRITNVNNHVKRAYRISALLGIK